MCTDSKEGSDDRIRNPITCPRHQGRHEKVEVIKAFTKKTTERHKNMKKIACEMSILLPRWLTHKHTRKAAFRYFLELIFMFSTFLYFSYLSTWLHVKRETVRNSLKCSMLIFLHSPHGFSIRGREQWVFVITEP